ncbi:DUF6683 family protein [Vandammella animalimorsus]|uniref:DUF6683 family protein n=1 Tax=Vandammella animalimorsus TaxID=2029117 RepID=UPI00117C78CC|nr:DUF6683 family protein [Vandammella animalimorsus]
MTPLRSACRTLLLSAALGLGAGAPAWSYWMSSDGGMSLSIGAGNYLLSSQVLKNSSGDSKKAQASRKAAPKPSAYRYRYAPAVSQQVRAEFMQGMRQHIKQSSAGDAASLAIVNALADYDGIASIREQFKRMGHDPDSVATAMAFWLLGNYRIVHGIDTAQIETAGLLKQLQSVLSSDSGMLKQSDADKQRMAELLLWTAIVQQIAYNQADEKNDASAKAQAASQARASLQNVGFDVDALQLDSSGLRLR